MIVSCGVDRTIGIIDGTVGDERLDPAEGGIEDATVEKDCRWEDWESEGKFENPTGGGISSTSLPV